MPTARLDQRPVFTANMPFVSLSLHNLPIFQGLVQSGELLRRDDSVYFLAQCRIGSYLAVGFCFLPVAVAESERHCAKGGGCAEGKRNVDLGGQLRLKGLPIFRRWHSNVTFEYRVEVRNGTKARGINNL
jgi:hypothetical protein